MTTQAHKFPGNRKPHTIKVFDSDGVVLSQTVRLDDDGIRSLQHGIRIAQGVDWSKTRWTRGEALDMYAEQLGSDSRFDLVCERMDTVNDIELLELMEYMTEEDEKIEEAIEKAAEDTWGDCRFTKQQSIDRYSDCLSEWKKNELIQDLVEKTSDDELKAFMEDYMRATDIVYISDDDIALDHETAKQYQADRRRDDAPESS